MGRNRLALRVVPAFLLAALFLGTARGQEVTIYTKDNAPAAPKLEDLELKDSVVQYGITWTFEAPARVGQFVGGDYYVVGPVTVKAIDPKPLFGEEVPEAQRGANEKKGIKDGKFLRNGSMLNPPAKLNVFAYDSGIRSKPYYHAELAARLPVTMKPGDALVSSVSLKVGERVPTPEGIERCYREHHDDSPIRTMAVLTCLAEPVPADAFRPSPFVRKPTIYLARNLRRDLLPKLEPAGTMPPMAKIVRIFQRPWINTCWFGFDLPIENMPHYGQHIGASVSLGSMVLCCDLKPGEKEPLLLGMTQAGIDLWGTIDAGHPGWCAWGGHHSGRKPLIVLAGIMLGDTRMASPTKTHPEVQFQEDEHTGFGEGWTGSRVVFQGVIPSHSNPATGPYEHRHPSQWVAPRTGDNRTSRSNWQSEGYRRCCTSVSWPGYALMLQLLHAEQQWGHDAFFVYVDRWMMEDNIETAKVLHGVSKGTDWEIPVWYLRHKVKTDAFVQAMWDKYRPTVDAPIDGWRLKRDQD